MRLRFAASIVAVLAFSSMMIAQTGKPSEAEKNQAVPPALSHDLSGVWMQYPSGAGPGIPGMNAVDEKMRPPLTAWGQAKFDAAKPVTGPRAVPGEEGNPSLRCEPDSPPRLLFFPTHLRSFRFPAECSCSSRSITLGALWAAGGSFPRILIPLGWGTRWESGREILSL